MYKVGSMRFDNEIDARMYSVYAANYLIGSVVMSPVKGMREVYTVVVFASENREDLLEAVIERLFGCRVSLNIASLKTSESYTYNVQEPIEKDDCSYVMEYLDVGAEKGIRNWDNIFYVDRLYSEKSTYALEIQEVDGDD